MAGFKVKILIGIEEDTSANRNEFELSYVWLHSELLNPNDFPIRKWTFPHVQRDLSYIISIPNELARTS